MRWRWWKTGAPLVATCVALLCVVGGGARVARADGGCSGGKTLLTAAHEDDSILFEMPDLAQAIAQSRCVETVFLTAGDGGLGTAYWQSRENGALAAYAEVAGVANAWTQTDAGIPGHPIPVWTLNAQQSISIAFMRLPDGKGDGSGFAADGSQSLQKLWNGQITQIAAVDGSSTYTLGSLAQTLTDLMTAFQPDVIGTQDFVGSYGDGDHSDHHTTGYLTRAAGQQYATSHQLLSYGGYPITNLAANLNAQQTQAKQDAFFAYAPFDSTACQTPAACAGGDYPPWWARQYVTATVPQPDATAPSSAKAFYVASTTTGVGGLPAASLGDTLSAADVWTGSPTLTYQWQRCDTGATWTNCAPMPGASASTYTVTSNDLGHPLALVIKAVNAHGTVFVTEHAVTAGIPVATVAGSLTGTAQAGQTLTLHDPATWTGDTPITFTHSWNRCDAAGAGCSPIAGASASTYQLTSADVDHTVWGAVGASNARGTGQSVTYGSAVVAAAPSGGGGGGGGGGSGGGGPLDLAVAATASAAQISPGESVTYRIQVSDLTNSPATNLHVAVTLPTGALVGYSYADRGPGCTPTGAGTLDCNLDNLGSYAPTGNITLVLTLPTAGTATLTAAAKATQSETVTGNNQASVTVQVGAPPAPPTVTPAPVKCVVPSVTGKTLAHARTAITKAHCAVGTVGSKRSTQAAKGKVVAQSPKAKAVLKKGARINLTLGTGKR